jgi:hypothetical protein
MLREPARMRCLPSRDATVIASTVAPVLNVHAASPADYVASIYDIVHDNGLRTCMFASKSKFVLYDQSYDGRNGAPDTVGADNGRDKIDLYVKDGDSAALTDRFHACLAAPVAA